MIAQAPIRTHNQGGLYIVQKNHWTELRKRFEAYSPKTELGLIARQCFKYLPAELAGELLEQISRVVIMSSTLSLKVYKHPDYWGPKVEDWGTVSYRKITTAGVNALVDAYAGGSTMQIFKFHGIGTGSAAEANTDTKLVVEALTEYTTANTRGTGTTVEGASANIFKSVATNMLSASLLIGEHGIFSVVTASTGVLWDRHVTGGNVINPSDTLETTYNCTVSAEA